MTTNIKFIDVTYEARDNDYPIEYEVIVIAEMLDRSHYQYRSIRSEHLQIANQDAIDQLNKAVVKVTQNILYRKKWKALEKYWEAKHNSTLVVVPVGDCDQASGCSKMHKLMVHEYGAEDKQCLDYSTQYFPDLEKQFDKYKQVLIDMMWDDNPEAHQYLSQVNHY